MKHTAFFLCLICFLVVSCKKDKPPSYNCDSFETYHITSADLINCEYNIGSYWIMIDSATMFIDSIKIAEVNKWFPKLSCDMFETHSFMVTSNLPGFDRYAIFAGGLYKGFSGIAYSGIKIYDDYVSPSTITPNDTRLDSLFVYDRYYYKVLRVEIADDGTEGHNRSVYYTNSDYGVLKHEVYDDNNYRLSNKILMRKSIVR